MIWDGKDRWVIIQEKTEELSNGLPHLQGANLRNADLSLANVGGGASLEGANLRDTDLRWTKLNGATYDETTVFPDGFDPLKTGMRLTGPTAPSQLCKA